jgi:hypothetical protein
MTKETKAASEGTALQLLLPCRRLGLLPLAVLLVRVVAAIGAAGDGADYTVVTSIVTGDAADHGAFQAAFCIGRRSGCDRECGNSERNGRNFHGRISPEDAAC